MSKKRLDDSLDALKSTGHLGCPVTFICRLPTDVAELNVINGSYIYKGKSFDFVDYKNFCCVIFAILSDEEFEVIISNITDFVQDMHISMKRIRLIEGPCSGLVNNYELLLSVASGEYIFLADQDDVWLPNKVEVMLAHLHEVDMVVCDCIVVDGQLNMLYPSFFALINSKSGVVRNLLRNRYLGCCIALRRRVLKHALPFPAHLPVHDWWLGLVADIFGGVTFINQPLMMYRRHGANASPASERSSVVM